MANTQQYGAEARAALLAGVTKLNRAVSVTLGPAGRTVLFRHMGMVISTKDGVTVAREINLSDPYESIGADLVKAAAGQTVDEAGDGTTTATLLTHAIFEAGCKAIDEGAEPVQLVKGIDRAVTAIVGEYDAKAKKFKGGILETFAVPCTPELAFNAARISSNGDDAIARVIADTVLRVGVEGDIQIGDSFSHEHTVDFAEGMGIQSGMAHPYFTNDPRNRTVLEGVQVLVINRRISTATEVVNLLTAAAKRCKRDNLAMSLLVIADDFDPEALGQLIHHRKPKQQGGDGLNVLAVRAPLWKDARRDILEDICLITGATRIENPVGKAYDSLSVNVFGLADRVVSTLNRTTISAGAGDDEEKKAAIADYLSSLKVVIDDVSLRPDQIDAAKSRYAALTGGVAVIKVGGTSANAVTETKFRVEDALHACRAAVSDGVVPGGGSALLFAAHLMDRLLVDEPEEIQKGASIVSRAIWGPICQIAENAGYTDKVIEGLVILRGKISEDLNRNPNHVGFDASTGLYVEDMIATGIVDPLRVVRAALNAAASAAGSILLKTEAVIAHDAANTAPQIPGR